MYGKKTNTGPRKRHAFPGKLGLLPNFPGHGPSFVVAGIFLTNDGKQ